jgi:catechol 2,3-dioxygenase-like lactoylglutathione lyase family enzyme
MFQPDDRLARRPRIPDPCVVRPRTQNTAMFQLECIDHVALLVRDVERSVHWYQEVLGLQRLYQDVWGSFPAVVGVGGTSLALFPVTSPAPNPPPGRDTICVRHIAFRVDQPNLLAAREALQRRGIPFRFQDHDAAHSIYFEDPDGHQLEITTYLPSYGPSAG